VLTVNLTELVLLRIPDLLTEQGADVVEQLADPLAPLLQLPATVVETGEPPLVTDTVTVAVHVEPLLAADLPSATVDGTVTVTSFEAVAVAASSSVVVSATENVPADG
jgi:hypothetical protein